ncbi:MAG: phospholipid carrier-dependent glycosyltransferase [Ardenticatenales bacterium]|nr:phospholipid carrier-dependent glycosyltransferase [Ardenticatenales bacterium]
MPHTLTRRLPIAAAILAFLLLGAAYARTVPPWEAPDEPWHAAYAVALADGRLPTADETYEHHHPPLAYGWYALGIRLAGIDALPLGEANPRYPFAAAALSHPPGDPLVGRVAFLRTWGALLAVLAVPLTFAAARVAGWRGSAAAAPAVLTAVWPQFVFTGHTISNDGLATVAGALLLYAFVRAVVAPSRAGQAGRSARFAASAAFLGAAVAVGTKLNAAVLVPAGVAAAMIASVRLGRRRASGLAVAVGAIAGTITALAFLALAAPTALRSLAAQVLVRSARSAVALPPAFAADTLTSFWARFGWANVDVPPVLLDPVVLVAVLAAACLPLAAHRQRAGLLAAATIMATAVAAFGVSALADPQPQGRLLLPALPATALLLTAGWAALPGGRWRAGLGATALAVGLATHAAALAVVLPRAYRDVAPDPGVTIVRHLPAGWRVVATVTEGKPAVQAAVAQLDGLRRIELPMVVQAAGTVRLIVTNSNGRAVGSAMLPVDVTRARPWYGEGGRGRCGWAWTWGGASGGARGLGARGLGTRELRMGTGSS